MKAKSKHPRKETFVVDQIVIREEDIAQANRAFDLIQNHQDEESTRHFHQKKKQQLFQ